MGRQFSVQTDHRALQWLSNHQTLNSRLMRWSLALQPYQFIVIHHKGVENANADALSRSPHKRRREGCDRINRPASRLGQNQQACQQPYHHIQDDGIVVSIDNSRMFFNFCINRALLYIILPSLYFESMNATEILLCSWASRCYIMNHDSGS